jgi:hypothetical protein
MTINTNVKAEQDRLATDVARRAARVHAATIPALRPGDHHPAFPDETVVRALGGPNARGQHPVLTRDVHGGSHVRHDWQR